MTRRELLGTAVASVLPAVAASRAAKPNIVYIMADDLGYADLSCYGRTDYRTPNIDRLAVGGMRFLQAYANSAVCSATRTALITGRYQYRLPVGLEEPISENSKPNQGLPPSHPTLPSLLKKAGYGTALVGKWHLGELPSYGPLQSGYDQFWGFRGPAVDYFTHAGATWETDLWDNDRKIEQPGYMTTLLGDHAVAMIDGYAKSKRPFFLSVHFSAPHWPWEGPGDETESKRITALKGNMNKYDAGTQKSYAAMVEALDVQVGRIVKAVDAHGLAGNTVIVFTSDNGGERFSNTFPFTGRKTELLEGGLRIPAIVRWPGRVRAGSTTDQAAMSMDWMPTFLAMAGAQADPAFPMDGMDLGPTLAGSRNPVARKLYWRYKRRAQRAMRDGDMKWLKINENEFLFDLAADPMERANLKDRQPDVFARFRKEYAAWEATMLPEDPATYSTSFGPTQLADHFNTPPAPANTANRPAPSTPQP